MSFSSNENGPATFYGIELKRIHGDPLASIRIYHSFGLLGVTAIETSNCCIEVDHAGNVIRDTTEKTRFVYPPLVPFVRLGIDWKVTPRARMRLDGQYGPFLMRAMLGVMVPLGGKKT